MAGPETENPATDAFRRMRQTMVQRDLEDRGIRDRRLLDAMGRIPRERFVDTLNRGQSYADHPLPIGSGQTISQPYMVALMTEALELHGGERVLEIGTGSGYQTAILAELAAEVYTIERLPELAQRAQDTLAELGYANVHSRVGDGTLGWEEEAPFDRVIVTAAAPNIPPSLKTQISVGGTMVIPVGEGWQTLVKVRRTSRADWEEKRETSCVFVPLIGKEGFPEKTA